MMRPLLLNLHRKMSLPTVSLPLPWLASLLLFLILSSEVHACPGILWGDEVIKNLGPANRQTLALYILKSGAWYDISLQIDPVDKNGKFMFFPDHKWEKASLAPLDRLTFDYSEFGARRTREPFPCSSNVALEVNAPNGNKAYFINCPNKPRPDHPLVASHDTRRSEISTSVYRYRYAPYNHLLFDELNLGAKPIAAQSDQFIFADLINFFSLTFGAKDFDAKIEFERTGPVALVGRLTFVLKILMFSIDLHLYPEVSFFKDAVHVPMVMQSPVDAPSYVHRGSGLFYSWVAGPGVSWLRDQSRIPPYGKDPRAALEYCDANQCYFSIKARDGGDFFALDFTILRSLVAKGFFPQIIWDLDELENKLKMTVSKFPARNRIGVFFEISGLAEGAHLWDFWLRFGKTLAELDGMCSYTQQPNTAKVPP